MAGGTMQAFGRKAEVLNKVLRADGPQPVPAEANAMSRREGTVVPFHEIR